MYVKIWAIKSNTVRGGKVGLKNSLNYINDDDKTITEEESTLEMGNMAANAVRTLEYMGNEEKTQNKYISGYLCDPEFAVEQFMEIKEQNLARIGKTVDEDTGNFAYHIIQSFPDDLEISAEEVHQCGIELAQKLGTYQAVICSHVNPIVDEDTGEVHGLCKHNHILINSHCSDPVKQYGSITKMKYNDCKETYAELQRYNDEIALAHGLPIIDNPDMNRKYSWVENKAIKDGTSWKEQIRNDIDLAKRETSNWEDFKKNLIDKGYEIKEGKYTSYKAPGQERSSRCKTLGDDYTKDAILGYWKEREKIKDEVNEIIEDNKKKEKQALENYYFNPRRYNTKTKKPYRIGLYDKYGIKRSTLELMILLAMVIIKNEGNNYQSSYAADAEKNPIYGKTDWKLQNMVDTIKISREEKVNNLSDVEKRLNDAGITLARLKSQIKKADTAINNMTILHNHLDTYLKYKEDVESIKNLPEGDVKEQLKAENASMIKAYAESMEYLNAAPSRKELITDETKQTEFINRYEDLQTRKEELELKLEEASERYRKYKKLSYHLELAQSDEYCYGPDFTPERQEELHQKMKEEQLIEQEEREQEQQHKER